MSEPYGPGNDGSAEYLGQIFRGEVPVPGRSGEVPVPDLDGPDPWAGFPGTHVHAPCSGRTVHVNIPPFELAEEAVDDLADAIAERLQLAVCQDASAELFDRMRDGTTEVRWQFVKSVTDTIQLRVTKRDRELWFEFVLNAGTFVERFRFRAAGIEAVRPPGN